MIYSAQDVAVALARVNTRFPTQNIDANWPLLWASLDSRNLVSRPCEIAAIATVAVETGAFAPVKERGGPNYFIKLYWENQNLATTLGNKSAEDAVMYRGRGFVQITGRANYLHFGKAIGHDLVARPDDALIPAVAADILAAYFYERQIAQLAEAGRWEHVRRRVNGGLNGWGEFIQYVSALQALGAPPQANASAV